MIATAILRAFQLICAAIVLGLAVSLARGQVLSPVPPQTGFVAFCGGWALVIAFFGIIALFVESLSGLVAGALDALTALFTLAGGITYAVSLGVGNCDNVFYNALNVIIRGAGTDNDGIPLALLDDNLRATRCHEAQATTAFLFFAFAAFLASAVLCFMGRGGKRASNSYA